MRKIFKRLFGRSFDNMLLKLQPPKIELTAVLQDLLVDTSSLADMGCGEGSHLRNVVRKNGSKWIGVDSHQGSLDAAVAGGIYDQVCRDGIVEWLVSQPSSSIDTILASCVIEHLEKEAGLALVEQMKRVASGRVIVFTPNGFVPQPGSIDNPANAHRSGWTVVELEGLGFNVSVGLYGLRKLRTSFGLPTIRPMMMGDFFAKLTSRFVFHRPKLAYQIVGVYHKRLS
jgi:hypothetical protein